MKSTKLFFTVLGVFVILFSLGSCSKKEVHETKSTPTSVNSFEIREALKTAAQNYRLIYSSGDTACLSISAAIQWPEKLGSYSIVELQDTLIATLQNYKGDNIDQALTEYVNNPYILEESEDISYKAELIDTLPEDSKSLMVYEISTKAFIRELNEKMVTYQVDNYSFTGGAHPLNISSPFTYDIVNSEVMTFDNTFLSGYEHKLFEIVQDALAKQMGVTKVSKLSDVGFFVDQFYLSQDIYILNGQIVFHYNPYDIAPYAMGEINVSVAPYILKDMLTTQAKQLLLE